MSKKQREYEQSRIYDAYKVTFTVPAADFGAFRDFAIDRVIDLADVRDCLASAYEGAISGRPAQIERVEVMETVSELPAVAPRGYEVRIDVSERDVPQLAEYAEDGEISAADLLGVVERVAACAINGRAEVERVELSEEL